MRFGFCNFLDVNLVCIICLQFLEKFSARVCIFAEVCLHSGGKCLEKIRLQNLSAFLDKPCLQNAHPFVCICRQSLSAKSRPPQSALDLPPQIFEIADKSADKPSRQGLSRLVLDKPFQKCRRARCQNCTKCRQILSTKVADKVCLL